MQNIKLEDLAAGDTIYCCMIEASPSGIIKRLAFINITGPAIFQEHAVIIPGEPSGASLALENRVEFERTWYITEEAAIANPVTYNKL